MDRREVLKSLGASMALALLPGETASAWERVARGITPAYGFSARHAALIDAIADTILPRTDTPGATDVQVTAFVDVIVNENYTDAERAMFLAGLDGLNAMALVAGGTAFAQLDADARDALLDRIESADNRSAQPFRTYWRLKGLVIHGYFTSERVMKDVLHHEVMPGRFDGNAPMPGAIMAGQPRKPGD
jgi:hypothetical protein